jgi:hypothetical protein
MLAISVDTATEHFSCATTFFHIFLYPPKRKSYVLSTSVLDMIFIFWIRADKKAATPHHE